MSLLISLVVLSLFLGDRHNFVHIQVCLVCRYEHVSAGAHGGQKRAVYPLKLELQGVVNYWFGTGNQTQVLWTVHVLIDELSLQLLLLLLTDTKFICYRAQCDVSTCVYCIIIKSTKLSWLLPQTFVSFVWRAHIVLSSSTNALILHVAVLLIGISSCCSSSIPSFYSSHW